MSGIRLSGAKMAGASISLLLALAGILMLRREAHITGLVFTVIGVSTFITIAAVLQKNPIPEQDIQNLKPFLGPGLLLYASLTISTLLIYLMGASGSLKTRDYLKFILWIASMAGVLGSVLWYEKWHFAKEKVLLWWYENRNEILQVGGILTVALLARTILLGQHPYPWSGDEASIGSEARLIIQGVKTDLFSTGWAGQPNTSFLPTAFTLSIFGENIFGIRMMSVVAGVLAILFTYLFARWAFNPQVAFFAAAFLATFPLHVHFSRIGVDNIHDSLMIVLVMWLILLAIKLDRVSLFTLAGIAAGLAIFTYVGTRLVLGLAACAIGYICFFQKGFLRSHSAHLFFFCLAAVVTTAPIAYFFIRHPDIFMTRIEQEGIIFNNWLANESQIRGASISNILFQQVSRSTMVFISKPAPGNFFNSPQPYLTVTGAVAGLLGMGYTFQHIREKPFAILLGWFWAVVILGGILTLNPPANTRMLMTAPALAVFIGLGIWVIGNVLQGFRVPNKFSIVLGIILILVLTFENTLFYFGRYRSGQYFQNANSEVAQEIGLKLKALEPNYDYYLFGRPRLFAGFPTTVFLAPDILKTDLVTDDIDTVQIPAGRGAFFAAIPQNESDLEAIAQIFPGGEMCIMPRRFFDETLYIAYIVPPANYPRP